MHELGERMVRHRLHVLKIPTTRQSDAFEDNLFPYTHYADPGHDPRMEVLTEAGHLVLRCSDRMKLHPNYMTKPARAQTQSAA